MPPLPKITANIKIQTESDLNILNWLIKLFVSGGAILGTSFKTVYKIKRPNRPTNINIIRQENAWLMNVPNGIPQRFAIAILFTFRHLKNCIDTLFFGIVDKTTAVDNNNICFVFIIG